jgi:hypothetical protein
MSDRYVRIGAYAKALALLFGLMFALIACASASGDRRVLSGKMAWWQQAVGFWTCEVNLEPIPGQFAQKGFTVGEGSVAPDNVFHWSERASGIEIDGYDGYAADTKVWWEAQAGSTGLALVLRSSDGRTFEGVSPPGSEEYPSRYREIYSIRGDGTFHEVDKKLVGGSWRLYSESSCKRMP